MFFILNDFNFLFIGTHFCSVSLHHINDHNQLQAFSFECRAYNLDNQTSSNVRKFVNEIPKEFDPTFASSSSIVSDNENRMKCAFNYVSRVDCSIHYLNKVMEKNLYGCTKYQLKISSSIIFASKRNS